VNSARGLYAAAATLFAAGIVLRIVPVGLPSIGESARAGSAGEKATGVRVVSVADGDDSASGGQIIATNIFSRTRVAPTPAIRKSATDAAPKNRGAAAQPAGGATFKLYGTTIGPRGAIALIDAGTAARGAQVHRMGDTIAGARLVDITDSTVTLARQSGQIVLHVQSTGRQSP
jgi:hypothetical protein